MSEHGRARSSLGTAIEGIQAGGRKGAPACIGTGDWGVFFASFISAWRSSPIHEHSVDFGNGIGIGVLDLAFGILRLNRMPL